MTSSTQTTFWDAFYRTVCQLVCFPLPKSETERDLECGVVEDNSVSRCHWCKEKVKNPIYYFTKFANDYALPVSFCENCVPAVLLRDVDAILYVGDTTDFQNSNKAQTSSAKSDQLQHEESEEIILVADAGTTVQKAAGSIYDYARQCRERRSNDASLVLPYSEL